METELSHIFDYYQIAPLLLADTSSSILFSVLAVVGLLICSGLLSGSEVAYFSLGNQDVARLKEDEKSPSATRILALLSKPRYLLSTILISNNVINVAIILASNSLINRVPSNLPPWANFIITVGLVTFLLVLFGEIAPKVYATQNNERIARFMSAPLLLMERMFVPLSWILVNSTRLVEIRLRRKLNQGTVSQEDIASAIELTVKGNKHAKQDVDMLKGIVRFGSTSAAEIMKPRMDVVALDIDSSYDELVNIFREKSHSRIPIYKETLDHIEGIIHAKDLLEHLSEEDGFNWHELIRPPLVATENRKIDDLFHDFQEARTHMAIVVDEYGGTKGIVTLEDILEEIVGEIQDEFDIPEKAIFDKIDDYTYDFDGSTTITEICRALDLNPDFFDDMRKGAETVAGLVLVLNGTIPSINSSILCKEYHLITLEASKRRIKKIRIVLPNQDNINTTSSVSKEN